MNHINIANLSTPEDYLNKLMESVNLRNKMCGSMYYNIINDDCKELADRCVSMGYSVMEIQDILLR